MKTPTYPRQGTNTSRFLARLLTGEPMKHRDADSATGSYRLAVYVHYLKTKHHWPISSREFTDDTLDPIGRQAIYKEYWLDIHTINRAGEEGQQYAEQILGWELEKIATRVAATTPDAEIDRSSQTTIDNQSSTIKDGCQASKK